MGKLRKLYELEEPESDYFSDSFTGWLRLKYAGLERQLAERDKRIEGLEATIEAIKNMQTHELDEVPGSYEGLKIMCKSDEKVMNKYCDAYVEAEALRELLTSNGGTDGYTTTKRN